MFSISQIVKNKSGVEVSIAPFTKIFRNTPEHLESTFISHEGFVGHLNGLLHEEKYDEIMSFTQMREAVLFYNNLSDKQDVCFQVYTSWLFRKALWQVISWPTGPVCVS